MKKILVLPLLLTLLLLCAGCSSDGDGADGLKKRLALPFEYSVKSDAYSFTYKKEEGKATATLTSPESLGGLTLVRDESGVNASYDGITVTLPPRAAKRIFTLDDVINAVSSSLGDGTYVSESTGTGRVYKTTSGIYVYSVEVNGKTGDVVSAKAENGTETYEYTFLQ